MKFDRCVFCDNILDGSDEHIIPDCLNGTLHSTEIICHNCNTNKFGLKIDPVIKLLFKPILLTLGFDNIKAIHSEAPDGKEYKIMNNGEITPIKPDLVEINSNGKTIISVIGKGKDALKKIEKHKSNLLNKGYRILEYQKSELNYEPTPPLRLELNFMISQEIIIELNKIAIEFYALNGLDLKKIIELSARVNILDKELNNVVFCNWTKNIRELKSDEISHLIVIRKNQNGDLYCYIELFNIICAYIKLYDCCEENIDFVYHQDALTGERFNENILLSFDTEPTNKNKTEDFSILINSLFDRLQNRIFSVKFKEICSIIKEETQLKLDKNEITKIDFNKTYIKGCCEALAQLSVYDFPYMIDDYRDEENSEINYIHSNMSEKDFNDFSDLHKKLIGKNILFPENEVYSIVGFIKQPFLKRNAITLVKVYCELVHIQTNRKKYIPYRDFFEGLNSN